MKIKSLIKTIVIAALIFALALILPKPTVITEEPMIQSAYQATTHFLYNKLGFSTSAGKSVFLAFYSTIVALMVWIYYRIILLLRFIIIKDWKKVRGKDTEGGAGKLISLSRYRLINIFFGNIYKLIAFIIFTIILYNIPILNRLIYIYMLEFLDLRFIFDAFIVSILIIILPVLAESFLLERRKTKMERGMIKIEKIKSMVANADNETA